MEGDGKRKFWRLVEKVKRYKKYQNRWGIVTDPEKRIAFYGGNTPLTEPIFLINRQSEILECYGIKQIGPMKITYTTVKEKTRNVT